VEHACYKCGANVEDGVPFCPQCNAPQIRVEGSLVPTLAEERHAPSFPDRNGLYWSDALPAAAFAGLIAGLLMFVALGVFGLGLITAGALSVVFYRGRRPAARMTPGLGARLGAMSGALGFVIFGVLSAGGILVFHSGGELRTALLQAIEQSAARSSDPQAQQVMQYFKTPPGLALMVGFSLVFLLVASLVLTALGGAIGASLTRKKDLM